MAGYVTCWNHHRACLTGQDPRGDDIYDQDCLRSYEANCVGPVRDLCEVSCRRLGRRGSFTAHDCREGCVERFPKFKYREVSIDSSQQKKEVRPCTDAFGECVGAGGEVDENCVEKYDQHCIGSLSQHCDLACIRTPYPECHDQCLYHFKVSTEEKPPRGPGGASPQRKRQVWGKKY
jgi:hypothetical protein